MSPIIPAGARPGPNFWKSLALLSIIGLAISGCARDNRAQSGIFAPYRISIPQGNYVNQQMLDQVQRGMSREQVRLAMGTPLLADPFHHDRWDYVFRFQYPNGDAELRRVTIRFADDIVSGIEADHLPERDDHRDPALPGYRPDRAG